MPSRIEGPESIKGFQKIRLSGYLSEEMAQNMLNAYKQVEDEPKILLDLSNVENISSLGMQTLVIIVHEKSLDPNSNQEVYIIVPEIFKELYFDERPWAAGRVFTQEEDVHGYLHGEN